MAHRQRVSQVLPVSWRIRYRLTPWWARVLVVWVLSRIVTLGLNARNVRLRVFLIASLMTGVLVAISGSIGFVGAGGA